MQLDDVRAALQARADAVPSGSVEPTAFLTHAQRSVRWRCIGRTSFALGLVIAVVGAVVAIRSDHTTNHDRVIVSASTTTTVAPRPSETITDEQMRAHLGERVPAGWVPVDESDARLFVPPDWLDPGSGCVGDASAPGIFLTGGLEQACGQPADQYPVSANAASIAPALPSGGTVLRTVHGYHLYAGNTAHFSYEPPWTIYNVPALNVEIAVRGSLGDRILATLAPSAEKIARTLAPQMSAPTGQVVSADGVRVTIPQSWAVAPRRTGFCNWPVSDKGTPELVHVSPDDPALPCPPPALLVSGAAHDGVFVDTVTVANIPLDRSGPPFLVLHHGATTVSLKADLNDPNLLDVYAQRAGSPKIHSLRVGLGRDGRVAAAIIAAIEATS